MPYLVTGLITAAGGAWNATIVAEYLHRWATNQKSGVRPRFDDQPRRRAPTTVNAPLLAASAVTMAVFVVVVNRLVWKRLGRLASSKYSLGTVSNFE